MFPTIIHHIWNHRIQLSKYAIIGMSAFCIDVGLLVLIRETTGTRPLYAVLGIQVITTLYVFFLNKYWSFQNHDVPHKQFVRYLILVLWNYVFGATAMYLFNEAWFQFNYLFVRVATIAISVSWNFILYKKWVYATREHVST